MLAVCSELCFLVVPRYSHFIASIRIRERGRARCERELCTGRESATLAAFYGTCEGGHHFSQGVRVCVRSGSGCRCRL